MGLFYLRHPLHGEKVTNNDLEAYADRKNGWKDFDPDEQRPAPPAEQEEIEGGSVKKSKAHKVKTEADPGVPPVTAIPDFLKGG